MSCSSAQIFVALSLLVGASAGCAASHPGSDDAAPADAAPPDDAAVDAEAPADAEAPGTPPAIFYVPHQDDDFLAMALGISEHLAAGRHVRVILYTSGGNGGLRDILNGMTPTGTPVTCPLHGSTDPAYAGHPQFHAFGKNDDDVKAIRTEEFVRSMVALGVSDYQTTGWDDDAFSGKDDDPFTTKLEALILANEMAHPGTSHKCVAGPRDCQADGNQPFPTHIACWYAAKQLIAEYPSGVDGHTPWDFRFYDDYIYFRADTSTWNLQVSYDLGQFMPSKYAAYEAYHQWRPEIGRYALGYHSVPQLFDRARDDSSVHIETIDGADPLFRCPNE